MENIVKKLIKLFKDAKMASKEAIAAAKAGQLGYYKYMCFESANSCTSAEQRHYYHKEYLYLCSAHADKLWKINNKNK